MSSLAESMFSFYYEGTPEPDGELLEEMMYNNGATFYYDSSSSCGSSFVSDKDEEEEEEEEGKVAAAIRLPVELLEVIFGFVAPDAADDELRSVKDLWSCAVTCRAWAFTAIPMLYRTHGFGVLMPTTTSG